jgi:PIN domain nuclease of toxin-antitoxin system
MMKNFSHLLDTHAWLWLILGDSRAERIKNLPGDSTFGISSISLWETILLHQKNRIKLHIPPQEFINSYTESIGIQIIDLSKPILLELLQLPPSFHDDPADRMITATALYHQVTLITADQKIIQSDIKSLRILGLNK